MDHDLSRLNDKEFEILCTDLIGAEHGVRYERFRPGRDLGVDGRFFSSERKEVVIQCKHWSLQTTARLRAHLEKSEVAKVRRLKPHRYILAVSNPLSRTDKEAIATAFDPYILSPSDIFGREDFNDLLRRHPQVERNHYKLWITSSAVLVHLLNRATFERSKYTLEQMVRNSQRYVTTANHGRARQLLEKHRTVIVAGDPGIGKTTLAEQLCLECVADEYQFVHIAENLRDAEDVFDDSKKQVFFFDDFLGRNYLEALSGHTGSRVVYFMDRVRQTSGKRFILTSRSTILNRGKYLFDKFEHHNIEQHECVLTIGSLSDFEKGQILYNHIWHSSLPESFVEELYKEKRYRKIIGHKNFNPRLVRFVTEHDRVEHLDAAKYWPYMTTLLDNPAAVWENPFSVQIDDLGRAAVLLVTINGRGILESELSEAIARFQLYSALAPRSWDFIGTLRQLTGSFLSRELRGADSYITLFSPSIGDFVLKRYSKDVAALTAALCSLRNRAASQTLFSVRRAGIVSEATLLAVARGAISKTREESFSHSSADFLSVCASVLIERKAQIGDTEIAVDAMNAALSLSSPVDCAPLAQLCLRALKEGKEIRYNLSDFLLRMVSNDDRDEDELRALVLLVNELRRRDQTTDQLVERLKIAIAYVVGESLSETVRDSDVFADVGFEDYEHADSVTEDHVRDRLSEFDGIEFSTFEVREVMSGFDVNSSLDNFYHGQDQQSDGERRIHGSTFTPIADGIDDLFDRS